MTQKRGLGRGLGALIPGAGSSPAPEQELRTRVRPESPDEEAAPSDRPVDMFFSGESASREGERPQRERAQRPDLAGDMARAAAQRRSRAGSARSASSASPETDGEEVADERPSTTSRTSAKRSTAGSSPAKKSGSTSRSTSGTKTASTTRSGSGSATGSTAKRSSTSKSTAKKASTKPGTTASSAPRSTKSTSRASSAPATEPAASEAVTPEPAASESVTPEPAASEPAATTSTSRHRRTSTEPSAASPDETPAVEVETVEPTPVQDSQPSPRADGDSTASDASPAEEPAARSASSEQPAAEPVGSFRPTPDGSDAAVDADADADADADTEAGSEAAGRTSADARPERSQDGLLSVPGAEFAEIPIHEVRENPRNPRTMFDDDELDELAYSLREVGMLQPVVVRPIPVTDEGESFELVMGERRWRAARRAELTSIPAIIRETSDDDLLRDALLENLHRTQLNPLEEANAYQQLLEDFGCTQDELGDRIGRSRPQITNTLRLLRLPALVQRRLASGALSAGHARALLSLDDPSLMEELAQRIVSEGLSVRAVERLVARGGQQAPTRAARRSTYDPHVVDLTSRLSNRLETPVRIDVGKRKGRITLEFSNLEDLDRVIESMGLDVPAPDTTQESKD
ncbi:ParB/RepB/Spo0J family partition protein [Brachybacterium fresconis]|uniref:ParB family chromosome partitioning protein n=1 Tax=Brachybacterium fresconis TaxID=173363 RepID=A0ABS4YLX1_9MICO|nr:ParB/RepB/Spo0J family partition protein [Brachybacterium fresconis]MBP2409605.1 ParB family chromosome partitioning protein [Brachybacterium fresconis]